MNARRTPSQSPQRPKKTTSYSPKRQSPNSTKILRKQAEVMLEKVKGNIYQAKRSRKMAKRISFAKNETDDDDEPLRVSQTKFKFKKIRYLKPHKSSGIKLLSHPVIRDTLNDSRNSIKVDSKDMIDLENEARVEQTNQSKPPKNMLESINDSSNQKAPQLSDIMLPTQVPHIMQPQFNIKDQMDRDVVRRSNLIKSLK